MAAATENDAAWSRIMSGKYSGATILEQGEHLTLVSVNGNELWIRNSELVSEPEPKSKPEPKLKSNPPTGRRPIGDAGRANISAGVKKYWRDRKGQKDVSEPRALDM